MTSAEMVQRNWVILTCALNGTLLTFFIHPVQIRQGNLLKNNNNNFKKTQEIIEGGTACEVYICSSL